VRAAGGAVRIVGFLFRGGGILFVLQRRGSLAMKLSVGF